MIIVKHILPRKYIPIRNKIELEYYDDESKNIDIHLVVYYLDNNKIKIIIRRLDCNESRMVKFNQPFNIKLYNINNIDYETIFIRKENNNCIIKEINTFTDVFPIDLNYEQKIPKIIFQTHTSNDLDETEYNSVMTFLELNPEYEYYFFEEKDCREYIKNNFGEKILNCYDTVKINKFKMILFRYCFLYNNGGCYFDFKTNLYYPLRNIIDKEESFVICKYNFINLYLNSIIILEKNNEIILNIIHKICYYVQNIYKDTDSEDNLIIKSIYIFYEYFKKFTPKLFFKKFSDEKNNGYIYNLYKEKIMKLKFNENEYYVDQIDDNYKFEVVQFINLEKFRENFKQINIPLKSNNVACIVEPRKHPYFEFVVKNICYFLPGWSIFIFHSENNKEYILNFLEDKAHMFNMVELCKDNLSIDKYSEIMVSRLFYNYFKENDYLLIFQTDSYICRFGIEKYIEKNYDFIGAPWPHEPWEEQCGNGGFSLRKISKMLEITETIKYNGEPEDIYFQNALLKTHSKLPYRNTTFMKSFSVENIYHPTPFATHKGYLFHTNLINIYTEEIKYIKIIEAYWGTKHKIRVKRKIQNMLDEEKTIWADVDHLGDHEPNIMKKLRIVISYENNTKEIEIEENNMITYYSIIDLLTK